MISSKFVPGRDKARRNERDKSELHHRKHFNVMNIMVGKYIFLDYSGEES